jgi:hypothetical protein
MNKLTIVSGDDAIGSAKLQRIGFAKLQRIGFV